MLNLALPHERAAPTISEGGKITISEGGRDNTTGVLRLARPHERAAALNSS